MGYSTLSFSKPRPILSDTGFFILRVGVALSLFFRHGVEKLVGFQHMASFLQMDPLHIGVYPSLAFATLSDGICTLLVVFGLFTRAASLIILVNLAVVLFVMQNVVGLVHWQTMRVMPQAARFAPPPGPGREHTELVVLYMSVFIFLLISGPGRLSLDHLLFWKGDTEMS